MFTTPWHKAYHPGQFFIHSKLGYRGIIAYAWNAPVYEFHEQQLGEENSTANSDPEHPSKNTDTGHAAVVTDENDALQSPQGDDKFDKLATAVKAGTSTTLGSIVQNSNYIKKEQQFYQVLVDERDVSEQLRSVAALIPNVGSDTISPTATSSFDYVDHRYILPYNASGTLAPNNNGLVHFDNSICSELFRMVEFRAIQSDTSGTTSDPESLGSLALPKNPCLKWNQSATERLSYSAIFKARTNGVEVTIIPFLLNTPQKDTDSEEDKGSDGGYRWAYSVMIENQSNSKITLVGRKWYTYDGPEDVDGDDMQTPTIDTGRGVVGKFPLLTPDRPVFVYSSVVQLSSDSGSAWGSFTFVEMAETRTPFEVMVPKVIFKAKPHQVQDGVTPHFSTGTPTKRSSKN